MSDHQMFREWPAAYVLGALDAEERRDFESHLGECRACADEVASFAPIPGLLASVETVEPPTVPERIAELAVERVRSDVESILVSRNRWRIAAAVAIVAMLAVMVPAVVGEEPSAPAAVFELEAGAQATGQIAMDTRFWGTALEFELRDLPTLDRYEAWVVSSTGEWQQVAAWGPTPAGNARLSGSSSIQLEDIDSVVITAGGRAEAVGTAKP